MVPVVRHCVGTEFNKYPAKLTLYDDCAFDLLVGDRSSNCTDCVARASSTLANCKASWVGQCTLFTFYEKAVPVSSTAIFGGSDLAT